MGISLSSCGRNPAEPFIGVWYGYKISDNSGELVFSENPILAAANMELTAEFSTDGTYELHYYVFGKEGEKYPKVGKYEARDNRLYLVEDNGYCEIIDGELILNFHNGTVKQYYRSNP